MHQPALTRVSLALAVVLLLAHTAGSQQPAAGKQPAVNSNVPASDAMEFSDQPHFAVAGVTDWTAAGGHGSDTTLRTSESLAGATAALSSAKATALFPDSTPAKDREAATARRTLAEREEANGDPLAAVHDFERAATLDPSEQNVFEWGSELLLHRAIFQAEAVFQKGVAAYPTSLRMQTGFASALFAGARYDDAATHLCQASDLDPRDAAPYLLLGKVQIAAPNALACVETRLARFVQLQPQTAIAPYLYAMALLKQAQTPSTSQHATELLEHAVTLDPTCAETACADAYLELGVLAAQRRDNPAAIRFYTQAIAAEPQLADAHYRLGVAYDRSGEPARARQEFAVHDQLKQQQAAAVEARRKAVKQFLFAQPNPPPPAP